MKPKPDLMLDLSVMVKFMKVAMLTQRMNAKHFMLAQLMELEVWPSTASNAQREALTSDALGGSGAPADYAAGDCSVEDDMFHQYMDHLGSQPLLICVNIEIPSYYTPK